MRKLLSPALCLASMLAAWSSASAQVGYPPTDSPFHELTKGRWIELFDGHAFGSGGALLVGPKNGPVYGARFDILGNHALQIGVGGWYAGTQRFVVDAYDSVATRVKGPVSEKLYAFEGDLQLNLTGGKRWHRFAPYATATFGLVRGEQPPAADTSGYSFGTKLFFGPAIGSRLFLSSRLFLKVEAQAMLWNLSYPDSYMLEPVQQPGTVDHPNAVNTTGSSSQYVVTPTLRFGLGIAF